jgi:glycosyltransferase involved in cell wall biosynthesis
MVAHLRILLLNEFFYPDNQGGTATATTNIARRLVEGDQVHVDAITGLYGYRDPEQRFSHRESLDGIQIVRTGNPNWGRERPAKRFVGNIGFAFQVAWQALILPKPNVTLVTTAPLTLPIAARILKRLRGVPYVYLIYDLDPDRTVALKVKESGARSVRLLRGWQRKWLHGADRVVVIGRCMKERLTSEYGVSAEKIEVVPVGADPDVIRPGRRDTEFRRRHGIEGFVVMYSGNFGQYHDFDTVLDAAERLRETHPQVHFVLVGGGKKKAYVEEQVIKRNLSNVHLHDFVPEAELSDLLASADISIVTLEPGMEGICVPSKYYSCLASGRPVLALMGPVSEIARVVAEEECGVRIEAGDTDGFVTGILDFVKDPEKANAHSLRARDAFDRRFTTQVTVGELAAILRAVAKP